MGFQLVTESMTLDDLRWPFQAISCRFHCIGLFESTASNQMKLYIDPNVIQI